MINQGLQFKGASKRELPEGFEKGQEYYDVNFYIDTPTYRKHDHQPSFEESDCLAFNRESTSFLKSMGYRVNGSEDYDNDVYIGEHGELYIHPDSIRGHLPIEEVERLHDKLSGREGLFTGRWTDVLAVLEIISEQELSRRLELSATALEALIFDRLKTTRRNKYFEIHDWAGLVYTLLGFQFMKDYIHREAVTQHIKQVVSRLVISGRLMSYVSEGVTVYRTANKGEQAKSFGTKKVKPVANDKRQQSLI